MPGPKGNGFVIVASPGTAVSLVGSSKSIKAYGIRLQPRTDISNSNIGNVYIGGKNLNKANAATIFAILSPEQVEGRDIASATAQALVELADWYVDADNAGDGVLVGYVD